MSKAETAQGRDRLLVGCRDDCEDSAVIVACNAHAGQRGRKAHAAEWRCHYLVAKLVDWKLDASLGVDVVAPRVACVLERDPTADLGTIVCQDYNGGSLDVVGNVYGVERRAGVRYEGHVVY